MVMSTVRESGWSIPLAMAEEDLETGSDEESMDDAPPVHPVPTMQGAFEESMTETMNGDDEDEPSNRYSKADSVTRRKYLLEQERYERTVAGRWKQKPGEKFHPLWKLVAQISFGMHLLQQGLAKSDDEVLKILQTHVDEVDGFLERTTEDFDLGQGDINERIRYLKLPLEHGSVFDQMLTDRTFRVAIVDGNEKIEHIIERTAAAMTDALKDVQKGLDATRELAKYMTRVDELWEDRTEEHDSVYLAMIGNTEGWTRAFLTLQSKGSHLRKALAQLGGIVGEMQRRAGAASRKNLVPSRSATIRQNGDPRAQSPQDLLTPPKSPNKPLPSAPEASHGRATLNQKYMKTPRSNNASPNLDHVPSFPSRSTSTTSHNPQSRKGSALSIRSPDPSRFGRTPTPDGHAHQSRDGPSRVQSPKLGLGISEISENHQARSVRSPQPPAITALPKREASQRPARSPEPQRPLVNGTSHRTLKNSALNHASPPPTQQQSFPTGFELQRPAQTPVIVVQGSPEPMKPQRKPVNRNSQEPEQEQILAESSSKTVPKFQTQTEQERVIPGPISSLEKLKQGEKSSTNLPIQRPSEYAPEPLYIDTRGHKRSSSFPPEAWAQDARLSEAFGLSERPPSNLPDSPTVPTSQAPTNFALLPKQPEFSPLTLNDEPDPQRKADIDRATAGAISKHTIVPDDNAIPYRQADVPDDSGGVVNASHPLLQEAHHARYASRSNSAASSIEKGVKPAPLRQYRSQGQLADAKNVGKTPNGTYVSPSENDDQFIMNDTLDVSESRGQMSPADIHSANSSMSDLPARLNSRRPKDDLGVHPAHRVRSPDLTAIPDESRPSTSSSEQGATPPPISNTRAKHNISPPMQFIPIDGPSLRALSPTARHKQSRKAPTAEARQDGKSSQTAADLPAPFYLNPASSTTLLDFLAATPPPSPPDTDAQFEPGTPGTVSTTGFFNNRAYLLRQDTSSPTPPAPGGGRHVMPSWALTNESSPDLAGSRKAGKSWKKKVFGNVGSLKTSKNLSNGLGPIKESTTNTKKGLLWRKDTGQGGEGMKALGWMNGKSNGHAVGNEKHMLSKTVEEQEEIDDAFVGVGADGQWISRKNFLRN